MEHHGTILIWSFALVSNHPPRLRCAWMFQCDKIEDLERWICCWRWHWLETMLTSQSPFFLNAGCPGITDSPESLYFSICITLFSGARTIWLPFLPILSTNRFLGSTLFAFAQLRWSSFVAVIGWPHPTTCTFDSKGWWKKRVIETPKRSKKRERWFDIILLGFYFRIFLGVAVSPDFSQPF